MSGGRVLGGLRNRPLDADGLRGALSADGEGLTETAGTARGLRGCPPGSSLP